MIWKNIYFWVATVIFLTVTIIAVTKVIPPALSTARDSRASLKDLNAQIDSERQFASSLSDLSKNQSQLNTMSSLAVEALPTKPDGEELMLQLDGLLASLNMASATATVPLSAGTPAPSSGTGTVSASQLAVTIVGDFNYAKARDLIAGLRGLIRWNKITSFDISQNGSTSHLSFTFNVFYKPGQVKTFSGDTNLLSEAKTLFDAYHSYTTRPNIAAEGTYGKTDPFSSP